MGEKTAAEFGAEGGRTRAQRLSVEERTRIARQAALARWAEKDEAPRATHEGELHIGGSTLPCAVLEDGTRVLTQWGFLRAIGRSGRPAAGRGSDVEKVAPFLALENLKRYVTKELEDSTKPIIFRLPSGVKAYGYRAEILPKVCEVYLQARDEEKLLKSQEKFARACEILMRGLAHVGIVALVDEATGYQADRAKNALTEILERFIATELRKWVKTFPADYYKELFRLRKWAFPPARSNSRPALVGKLTNDLVYRRLAPGVLEELKRLTPRDEKGRLKAHLHRRLTEDVGHPRLREHLAAVVALMKASATWDDFKRSVDRALPKFPSHPRLPLEDA